MFVLHLLYPSVSVNTVSKCAFTLLPTSSVIFFSGINAKLITQLSKLSHGQVVPSVLSVPNSQSGERGALSLKMASSEDSVAPGQLVHGADQRPTD